MRFSLQADVAVIAAVSAVLGVERNGENLTSVIVYVIVYVI